MVLLKLSEEQKTKAFIDRIRLQVGVILHRSLRVFAYLTTRRRGAEEKKNTTNLIHFFMCWFPAHNRSLRSSPGWIPQRLQPQFAFRVECYHHFVFTQDLQSEREMPNANLVTSWRPREGDRVLGLSLHSQPARWGGGKRSTSVKSTAAIWSWNLYLYILKLFYDFICWPFDL